MLYTLKSLRYGWLNGPHVQINGRWVAARPINPFGWHRFKNAWLVLTGKADAFTWPEGQ